MITERQMGEQAGWFQGLEIENTQFYGMPTVFFSRMWRLVKAYEDQLLPVPDAVRHVFIAPMNKHFFTDGRVVLGGHYYAEGDELGTLTRSALYQIALHYLGRGYKVTFELAAKQATSPVVTELRRAFPGDFCALVAMEIPEHELGAYAVKIIPTHCFSNHPNEGGVVVMPCKAIMAQPYSFTPWTEYEKDQDGD